MRGELKTALVLGAAIAAGIGVLSIAFSALDDEAASIADRAASGLDRTLAQIDKSMLRQAPDLAGIAHYLNTTPEQLEADMEGRVVLYDIWTYSCINCIRTLPYITAWDEKYADEGLLVIGVHSPEFEFEKNPDNVRAAVDRHGISYPVVMDNDMETWKAFENRYWPRKYVADHEGYIRYDHIGEGGYQETERVIQELLAERSESLGTRAPGGGLVEIDEFEHTRDRTPELYFGYKFAQNRSQLGSEEGFRPGQTVPYAEPGDVRLHHFYPVGEWTNYYDRMELESGEGAIKLLYRAKEVNIVTDGTAELEILLDGAPVPPDLAGYSVSDSGTVSVSEPDLYNIISGEESSTHELEIRVRGAGFQIFTYTFG